MPMLYDTVVSRTTDAGAHSAQLCSPSFVPRTPAPISGKILCVDNDVDQAELLKFVLLREGFTVVTAHDPDQARVAVQSDPPDLILLDMNPSHQMGLDLCMHFRALWHIPVILVASRATEADEIAAFECGADDFVTTPFTMRILVLRVRAVLRGSRVPAVGRTSGRPMLALGPALFNTLFNELSGFGTSVKLTPSEGKILRLLLTNEGQIISPQRIMARVMRYDSESSLNVVKTHIRNLRMKLTKVLGDVEAIRTVPGSGYVLSLANAGMREIPGAALGEIGPMVRGVASSEYVATALG
ncbi:MAG: DNA-binding response regulator [Chloroflexi bacterium]|nr:DNA-binding response regulator [Chloroflexota bacterium]